MSALSATLTRLRRLDLGVALPAAILVVAGFFLVRSADLAAGALEWVQLRWLGISAVVALPLVLVPYWKWLRFAPLFYLGGLGLLLLVVFFAPTINGARRWLEIGGFRFQPSEAAKFVTILMLARWLRRGRTLSRVRDWLPPLVLAAVPAALIFRQPDLGTSLLFLPLGLAVVFVSGMPLRTILALGLSTVLVAGVAWEFVLEDYQRERIWSTYNLDRMSAAQRAGPGYQLEQSLLAIGNGGVFGHGHGEGPRIQSGKLPYQYNDFVFAVAGEEHGFLGALALVVLYDLLVIAIFRVGLAGRDPAGRVLCIGVGTLLSVQAFVHMAVTLGLLPTKGLPLPFVSAGGTSLLSNVVAVAIVLNVAMNRPRVPITGLAPRD